MPQQGGVIATFLVAVIRSLEESRGRDILAHSFRGYIGHQAIEGKVAGAG